MRYQQLSRFRRLFSSSWHSPVALITSTGWLLGQLSQLVHRVQVPDLQAAELPPHLTVGTTWGNHKVVICGVSWLQLVHRILGHDPRQDPSPSPAAVASAPRPTSSSTLPRPRSATSPAASSLAWRSWSMGVALAYRTLFGTFSPRWFMFCNNCKVLISICLRVMIPFYITVTCSKTRDLQSFFLAC